MSRSHHPEQPTLESIHRWLLDSPVAYCCAVSPSCSSVVSSGAFNFSPPTFSLFLFEESVTRLILSLSLLFFLKTLTLFQLIPKAESKSFLSSLNLSLLPILLFLPLWTHSLLLLSLDWNNKQVHHRTCFSGHLRFLSFDLISGIRHGAVLPPSSFTSRTRSTRADRFSRNSFTLCSYPSALPPSSAQEAQGGSGSPHSVVSRPLTRSVTVDSVAAVPPPPKPSGTTGLASLTMGASTRAKLHHPSMWLFGWILVFMPHSLFSFLPFLLSFFFLFHHADWLQFHQVLKSDSLRRLLLPLLPQQQQQQPPLPPSLRPSPSPTLLLPLPLRVSQPLVLPGRMMFQAAVCGVPPKLFSSVRLRSPPPSSCTSARRGWPTTATRTTTITIPIVRVAHRTCPLLLPAPRSCQHLFLSLPHSALIFLFSSPPHRHAFSP